MGSKPCVSIFLTTVRSISISVSENDRSGKLETEVHSGNRKEKFWQGTSFPEVSSQPQIKGKKCKVPQSLENGPIRS
jgi:hypothetical protein